MQLKFDVPTPLEYFGSLVQSDDNFALFEAAISLAQDEYPEVDAQTVLAEVDQLLARVRRRLPADAGPLQKFRILNHFFYQELSFGGNLNDYYDPDNSFVSTLLRTRRGIPISLAVLWMELAEGLGLSVRGVAFPGHFMVKINLPLGQVIMDPMSGRTLSREELSERLEPFRGVYGVPEEYELPVGLYLQTAPYRDIIARMLRNLQEIYKTQDDLPRQLAVQERLVILLPRTWTVYRDRGLVHDALGHLDEAIADLECYSENSEDAPDEAAISSRLAALRRSAR
jgi:regulator of sirC expression with transglutaminase-like and TPR domain